MKLDLKTFVPHIAAILIFLLVNVIYFLPQIEGKKIRQTDTIQHKSAASEAIQYNEKGENILWTNSMFSGMPTYQISSKSPTNLVRGFEKLMRFKIGGPFGLFLAGLLACYLAFVIVGINKWLAIIGSILCTFNPNNLVLFEAGHQTKLRVILFSALIFVGIIKLFNKKYILGGVTFCLGLALTIGANHLQMTYYTGLTLILFGLIATINIISNKDFSSLSKIVAIGIFASIVALGTGAVKILPTYEYSKTTMRGAPILPSDAKATNSISSSTVSGLNWDYANQWSNGFNDLVGIYIPGVVGGGSNEPVSKNGPTNKYMKKNRLKSIEYGPMYWGKLPFTSGPAYMGASAIFLFILSLFVLDKKLRYWGLVAFVFTLMISLGKNLEWFNRLLFDQLPLFNKFRAPSSITSITTVIVSVLGLLGLNKILNLDTKANENKNIIKYIIISTSILAVISLFYGLLGPGFFDFEAPGDAGYAQQAGLAEAFQAERASIMRRDSFRSLFLVLGSAGILFFFLKNKINKTTSIILLSLLILIDIFPVNSRYVNHDSFVSKRVVSNVVQQRDVDKQILQDSDQHYRVHDVTLAGGPFKSANSSKFHKTIGGYHAAKLQRYQDLMDYHLSKGNQSVFNMLNAKYFILGTQGKEEVRQNAGALGNAWFVTNIQMVKDAKEEIESLSNLDTKTTVSIHEEFKTSLDNKSSFNPGGSIQLKEYHPENLVYESNNDSEGLAVFSEVWYGPKLGWNLYIDGEKAQLIRANYILRAALIPAGKHELVMKFEPKSFFYGQALSLICSILLFGGIIFLIWKNFSNKKQEK